MQKVKINHQIWQRNAIFLHKKYKYRLMILNISVKNYRSFRDLTTFSMVAESSKSKEENVFVHKFLNNKDEIRVLNTALIFGANASGKSNILRIVSNIVDFIVRSKPKLGETISIASPFKFDLATQKNPIEFFLEFIIDNIRYKYKISFDTNRIIQETLSYFPQKKEVVVFDRIAPENPQSFVHVIKIGPSSKQRRIEVFHNQSLLSIFGSDIPDEIISNVYRFFTKIEVIEAFDTRASLFLRNEISNKVMGDPKLLAKINALVKLADTGLIGFEVSENDLSLPKELNLKETQILYERFRYSLSGIHHLFDKGKLQNTIEYLPFNEESNGTKAIFSLGGKMIDVIEKGGLLLIDELESSLHPFLSKLLISLFQNKRINKLNSQLIFTTHETTLLDRNFFRKDQIWFAEKKENGATDLFSLQDYSDVREDTPFDKWYLAGKFGGIPNIASLESLYPIDEKI